MKKTVVIILMIAIPMALFAPSGIASIPDRDVCMDDYFMNYAPLTRETLQQALFYAGLTSPEIVFAQARLETGNFTSVLCVHYNNLFGMKMPRVRNTTAAGSTDNGYAVYESWYHSVLDMREFQEYYRAAGRCLQDYFSFLQGIGYAEDSYYIQKLAQLCSI